MAAPTVSMHDLLEAGAHFGHQTHRWNPKMKPYIFGDRNGVHIHRPVADRAADGTRAGLRCRQSVAGGGKVLFVGTKRQAQEPIAEAARQLGPVFRQPSLAGRHAHQLEDDLGLDQALQELEEQLSGDTSTAFTKKEVLS